MLVLVFVVPWLSWPKCPKAVQDTCACRGGKGGGCMQGRACRGGHAGEGKEGDACRAIGNIPCMHAAEERREVSK